MYKKKKGIILLECIIYISLSLILTCILVKILLNTDYMYIKTMKNETISSDIKDFFVNVERFINEEDVKKVEVSNNVLIIYKGTSEKDFQKEEIFKDDSKIMIKYYDIRNFEDFNARNTLALGVEEFEIKIKGKLIYLSLKKGGEEYIKCL